MALPKQSWATNDRDIKTIFQCIKVKHVSNQWFYTFLSYLIAHKKIFPLQHSESEFWVSWRQKHQWTKWCLTSLKPISLLQDMKFLPGCRATIWAGENASMNGGTMINALSHSSMRLGTTKQSCAKNFIAQEKKQIP